MKIELNVERNRYNVENDVRNSNRHFERSFNIVAATKFDAIKFDTTTKYDVVEQY